MGSVTKAERARRVPIREAIIRFIEDGRIGYQAIDVAESRMVRSAGQCSTALAATILRELEDEGRVVSIEMWLSTDRGQRRVRRYRWKPGQPVTAPDPGGRSG